MGNAMMPVVCFLLFAASFVLSAHPRIPIFTLAPQPPAPARLEAPPTQVEVAGHYYAVGKMGEAEYEALCTVRKEGDVYILSWNTGSTVGVGLRRGNTLSVGMRSGNSLGVLVYQIERDEAGKPKLVGVWTALPGEPIQHSETLTWLKELKQ